MKDGYEFAYIGAAKRAESQGFRPLVTFPSMESVYRSTQLPPLFSNRLMSASRSDFAEHLSRLALQVDEAEPFTVLARSAGRRETDKLEVFALPRVVARNGVENTSDGVFLARGVRHIPHAEAAVEHLQVNAPLYVMADVQNPFNPNGLALRNESCQLLGYVPDYLAQELAQRQCLPELLRVSVLRTNPHPAPVHHRLLCHFELTHASAQPLFNGPDYQPLSDSATPHSASAA